MTTLPACSHCKAQLSPDARFCSSCGYLASAAPANWFDRLCAATIDAAIWIGATWLLISLGLKWWIILPIWIGLTEIGYQLKGSIGKSLVGLTIPVKNRAQHYLRETIGKLASLATFGIGFLMVLSKERLGLHDYMAKTSVIRIGPESRIRQALISLVVVVGLGSCGYILLRPNKLQESPHSSTSVSGKPDSLAKIANQMSAVVTIYVYDVRGKPIGQGSGFLISGDGVCVTNFHVIKDGYSSDVKLGDGRLYHVLAVHGYDAERDIAIIQLGRNTSRGVEQAKDMPFVTLSNEEVSVGDRIAAVGSPEGLSNTVTDGLVSAIRNDSGQRLFQISAPISPGSSGGPVFNLKGEVVAISSFQLTEGQNLNFAIPVDNVSKIRDQRANLSLAQFYWDSHFSSAGRSTANGQLRDAEPTRKAERAKSLTGSFFGTVHNLTADIIANFAIFVEEDQGAILGCMAVREPLFGSGPLTGYVSGPNVEFEVNSAALSIQFTGQRNGTQLSGTYSVSHPNGSSEQGEFFLKKKDSARLPQDFDPQKDCPSDKDIHQ